MKNLKTITKYFFIVISFMCFSLTLFACKDPGQENREWETNYSLPSEENVNKRLLEIYSSQEKMYLLGNKIQRMPCPQNKEKMIFNMTYEVNDYVKIVLEDAILEINEVFGIINPNYKFAINYAPSEEDLNSEYSIRMTKTDNFSSPTTMGTAQMSTGTYLSNFGITLKDTTLNDIRYLMLTFRHEFMHLLGAGDAYNNSNAEKTTVMQNYNNTRYRYFSNSDVAFMDAYYRNPSNPKSDASIKNFIANYEQKNSHTQKNITAKVIVKALKDIDVQSFTEQLEKFNYNDIQDLLNKIQNGIIPNSSFGKNYIAFTELTYQENKKPESTYFGSFDPETQKYSHGKQTSLGSSQIISYKNFGNGLLFSNPNGSIILFVKIDNYVLLLDINDIAYDSYDYSYVFPFENLSFNIVHACSVN